MAAGAGKYDDLATYVLTQTAARAVAVIVFDGVKGSGFSAQVEAGLILDVPLLLRQIADDIENDMGRA